MKELLHEALHIGLRFELVVLAVFTVGLTIHGQPSAFLALAGALLELGVIIYDNKEKTSEAK